MKTISVNVSEPVYRSFQEQAKAQDRSTAELIRQAMEEYRSRHLRASGSVLQIRPVSLGRVLRPLSRRDDLLGEMLDAGGD